MGASCAVGKLARQTTQNELLVQVRPLYVDPTTSAAHFLLLSSWRSIRIKSTQQKTSQWDHHHTKLIASFLDNVEKAN